MQRRNAAVRETRSDGVGSHGPKVFVLCGATGELADRGVLPAFFTLMIEGPAPVRLAGGQQRAR